MISDNKIQGESISVWYYDLDANNINVLAQLLDNDERERASRFRFDKHKRRFITGRAVLRQILASYIACKPETIQFESGRHGKPFLYDDSEICFSVSNSHGLGAVAIALNKELGLDIEQVRANKEKHLIAKKEFSKEEYEWFNGQPGSMKEQAFFELWTCKEAYLKGKGLGLSEPLNNFAVDLCDHAPRLIWSKFDENDPLNWSLYRPDIKSGYIACLAIEASCGNYVVNANYWQPE